MPYHHINTPTVTGPNGEAYTSHSASGSVLESAAALESCLGCRESQGVENIGQMKELVETAQTEVAALNAQAVEKLADLNKAIGCKRQCNRAVRERCGSVEAGAHGSFSIPAPLHAPHARRQQRPGPHLHESAPTPTRGACPTYWAARPTAFRPSSGWPTRETGVRDPQA